MTENDDLSVTYRHDDQANVDIASVYIMGRSAAETQRLAKQAPLSNPITEHLIEDACITARMHVLDIGTGAGDVALLARTRR